MSTSKLSNHLQSIHSIVHATTPTSLRTVVSSINTAAPGGSVMTSNKAMTQVNIIS